MAFSLFQISPGNIDLVKSFALFYILILATFLYNLFTCYHLKFILDNKMVQYVSGFFLFYFLVSLSPTTEDNEVIPPIQKLLYTVMYYILFILTTRLDIKIMLWVLILVMAIYFIEINKDYFLNMDMKKLQSANANVYNDHMYWITFDYPFKVRLFPVKTSDFEIINTVEGLLYYCIFILIFVGLIAYGGELKEQIKNHKSVNWFKVFTDTKICDFKNRKSFFYYFKQGLSLSL